MIDKRINKLVMLILSIVFIIQLVNAASVGLSWVYPTSNINVSQYNFFNTTVNVSCFGSNCGEINVSLDPFCTGAKEYTSPVACTASGVYSGSYLCTKAIDGSAGTIWLSSSGAPEWILVDLGSEKCVSGLRVNPSSRSNQVAHVDISEDNVTWTRVLTSWTIPTSSAWNENTFNETTRVRYVRLNVTTFVASWAYIAEIEIITRESSKGGLITTNTSATPFYTNTTNPYNISLNQDESSIVTWWVNATGDLNTTYEFFVFANMTSNQSINNITSILNISTIDDTVPTLNITYPINTTYNVHVTKLNYTYSDQNGGGFCWYSNSSGTWNSTPVSAETNFTGLSNFEGGNTWTVYCNDSSGNSNSTTVTFTQDTPLIGLDRIYPTGNIVVNKSDFFNVSVNVSCSKANCGEINVSLDPICTGNSSYETPSSIQNCSSEYTISPFYCNYSNTGNINDGWISQSSGSAYSWIWWELNYTKCISGMKAYVQSGYNEQVVDVDVSDNGVTWTRVVDDWTFTTIGWNEETNFTEFSGNYVRFNMSNSGYYEGVWEVQFKTRDGCKAGIISMDELATPFYTNTTNPYNISLNENTSSVVTWWVNPTGENNTVYEFFVYANKTEDMTISNITSVWNVTTIEFLVPLVNITYPQNGSNYVINVSTLNYTVLSASGFNVTNCWWSNSSGVWNSSAQNPGTNWTGLASIEGWNNWTVFCNDTISKIGNDSVTFYKDTVFPVFNNITNQTILQKDSLGYQINATDSSGISCLTVNDSTNFKINCSGYLENNTFVNVGLYWLNITINDTTNNINSTLMWVNVTPTPQIGLTLSSPTGNVNVTQNQTFQVSVNVSCSSANCGEINLSLDAIYENISDVDIAFVCYYSGCSQSDDFTDYLIGEGFQLTQKQYTAWSDATLNDTAFDVMVAGGYYYVQDVAFNNAADPARDAFEDEAIPLVIAADECDACQDMGITTSDGTIDYTQTSITNISSHNIMTGYSGTVTIAPEDNDMGYYTSNLFNDEYTQLFDGQNSGWISGFAMDAGQATTGTDSGKFVWLGWDTEDSYPYTSGKDANITKQAICWAATGSYDCAPSKKISTVNTTTPYYTNTTNPYNVTLNKDESILITFLVNATGSRTNIHQFSLYANKTSDMAINNITDAWNVTITASSAPTITINNPSNNGNTTNTGLHVNYSATDANLDTCWYSNDTLGVNTTLAGCANITSITWAEGQHNVTIWANNTGGNTGTSTVTFTIDTVYPTISISTPNNNSNITNTGQDVNYSVYDTSTDSCWYSNDTMGVNTTLASCANITTITWAEGQHNVTVWINDTAGNKNTSSVTFIIDTIAPPISIAVPSNHTNTSNTGQDVNYSVLSADRHSCWYSNDTMGVNTTLASCANITTITWGKGEHNVTVWNNDTAGNKNSSTIRFTIDLTPPTFTTIANQTIESNDALGYDIDASDTYGVDCFTVNDTTNFQINCSGYLQNNTALSVNVYWINITVNDSHSNENSSLMKINVTSQTSSAINFVTPTPANLTAQSTTNVEINVSITESDLSELTYNWNGTNYTMYNDSMILMMNFDNVSALGENNTYVVDLSGNDDNGTVNGATWNNSGKYSGTYDFDGTSSDYITISDSPRVRLVDNFTIGVWVYSNNPSNSGRIYNKESSTNGLSNYILDIANNKIRFQFNDLTPITHLGVANITSQTWYHIMITYSSNTLTSYLNGTLDNVSTHSGTIGTSSNPFYIGRFDDQFNQNFNGSIDELRIWNRTLSAAEVYQQYASNLRKYNTNKWSLYVNQSKNATTGLVEGNYTYQVFSLNSENNKNSTGPRTVIIDTIAPTVSIAFPTNSTNHSNTGLNINYSVSDQNTISCWYSNDTMGVNTTLANCANITTITWEEGKHNVTIWVNDTAGNKNTTNVTFIIDTIPPTISIAIPSNYTNTSNTNQDINYSVSNPGRHSCWYSNDTMGVNTTLATCANITTITWAEGEHNVTVWVNDTTGNKNSSTIRFTIDLTSPTFTNLSNQTVEYGNALTYDLNSSDTVLFDCFSVNDTTNFKINCSGYLENNTNLSVNLYWLNITVNDTSNNQNSTLLQVNVNDTTSPTIILNNPAANLINDSVNVTNVTFNCSVTDLSNLFNISLYITNSSNTSFALNQTTNITRLSNSSNWSLSLPTGNYTWNCLGYDTYNNSAWASTNRTITIGFVDNDGDSVSDSLDLLEGNETNVNTTGLTSLNITISGNSTTGSYSDEQEIVFYDSSEKIVNFTHNFSSSQLDLSKVRVIKATNSIIINLSGQVQANYNKTVYITDNNFASLCVKDAEVNSIDNITSLCTGTNETDLTTCLGSSANLNNLNCSDLGSTIEIKNLRHSAIRGVPRSTQTTTPASSGGSGGGGSFSGGIASQITKECTNNSDCKPKYNCWNEKCVMLFDVRIIKFISPIETSKVINFTYLIKGKGYVKGDVIINYWLEKNNQILSQGKDTVYLDEYEEKGLIASLPLPTNTSEEPYLLYVSVDYQSYKTKASRTIEIKEDKVIAQPLTSPKKKVIPILLEKINLAGFLIILLIIFTINETINVFWHKDKEIKQKKIKQPIIPKEKPKSKTDKSKTSEGKELIKGLLKATLNKSEKESNIKEYESEDQEEENYYYEDIEDIEEISQL